MAERELFQIGEVARLEEACHAELDCIRLEQQPALRIVCRQETVEFHSYLWLERSIRQLEQDQKVPLSYIGKVGVGIPVHNGGHVLGECVDNASSDGMKLK